MNIETAIQNADFNQLYEISSNTIPILSFWGTRSIQHMGYNEKAS